MTMILCLNPFFIRSSLPSEKQLRKYAFKKALSQSLLHQVKSSKYIVHGTHTLALYKVSIPSSSGQVFQDEHSSIIGIDVDKVSIPSSSGQVFQVNKHSSVSERQKLRVSIPSSSGQVFQGFNSTVSKSSIIRLNPFFIRSSLPRRKR